MPFCSAWPGQQPVGDAGREAAGDLDQQRHGAAGKASENAGPVRFDLAGDWHPTRPKKVLMFQPKALDPGRPAGNGENVTRRLYGSPPGGTYSSSYSARSGLQPGSRCEASCAAWRDPEGSNVVMQGDVTRNRLDGVPLIVGGPDRRTRRCRPVRFPARETRSKLDGSSRSPGALPHR